MTASRKTAAELGLPEDVYAALVRVRDALDPEIPDVGLPRWLVFDMGRWGSPRPGDTPLGASWSTPF